METFAETFATAAFAFAATLPAGPSQRDKAQKNAPQTGRANHIAIT
jgi:hypothetical protein